MGRLGVRVVYEGGHTFTYDLLTICVQIGCEPWTERVQCTLPTYNDITWMFEPNRVPEPKLVPCFAWAVIYFLG